MLIEPMIHQLYQLRLRGMAAGLEQLLHSGPIWWWMRARSWPGRFPGRAQDARVTPER